MKVDILYPEFAEGGDEKAKVISWNFQEGASVEEGDEVLELLTDKATFTVPAPVSGRLLRQRVAVDDEVSGETVLGEIETG